MSENSHSSFSQILARAKSVLQKPKSSSLSMQIQERNKELQNLLSSYEEKFKLDEQQSKLQQLQETSQIQESHIKHLSVDAKHKSDILLKREADFHKELLDFQRQKLFLDSKQEILNNQLVRLDDPRVKKVLDTIDDKFSMLKQSESLLAEQQASLQIKEEKLQKQEQSSRADLQLKQQELLNLEQDIQSTFTKRADIDQEIRILTQKKNELDLIVKERSTLIQRLTKQYADSKTEFTKVRDATRDEQKVLIRTREEVQLEKQQLQEDVASFEQEKKSFYSNSKAFKEKSESDIEKYKSKILSDVQSQITLAENKVEELQSKELMLKKLEQELLQREEKLSLELQSVSQRSSKTKEQEIEIKKQLQSVESQKNDLESYESEVSQLEQTVLDLKNVLESKESEYAQRLANLEEREQQVVVKSKELDEHIIHFKDLLQEAGFEETFKSLLKLIKKHFDSGDISQARSEYKRACSYYRYLSPSARSHFSTPLKNLHSRISSAKQ